MKARDLTSTRAGARASASASERPVAQTRNLRLWAIVLLAVAGLAVSTYLLTVHLNFWSAVCLGVGDCELVNTSRFSEILGIPVALLGMAAYVVIGALGLAALREIQPVWARRGVFAMAAIGVAFSAYLTYIELFVLHEICPWCVLSAVLVTVIAVLSALELRAAENYEIE